MINKLQVNYELPNRNESVTEPHHNILIFVPVSLSPVIDMWFGNSFSSLYSTIITRFITKK